MKKRTMILFLLFLPLVLSNSTESSTTTSSGTTKVIQRPTTQKVPSNANANANEYMYQNVAKKLENACFKYEHETQKRKDFNFFIYQCLYSKKLKNVAEIEHHWNFCCRLRHSCHDGPSTDHNCRDIFCDCLDLVDLSNEPSISSCRSNSDMKDIMEDICGDDITPFQNRYVNIYENVGFAAIYGKNLVFGTFGWICMAIIFTIFLSATAYLIVSYVQFKCNKVTKEVISTKEAETQDEFSFPPPSRPSAEASKSKMFHDKIIFKA
uniref:Uncharacterized protein n=1 Tax=Panagrolaimus superbus TaxID=310955 RepID=A0A914YZV2_9BILA